MPGTQLLSIQYLRAFAALMVLGYHASRWVGPGFDIGAAGVDVFFVISGFILWTIAEERPVGPGWFLARRAGRVVPLYWFVTLAVAAVAIWAPGFLADAQPTVVHVLKSLFFVPHLNPAGQPFPLISIGWSLNYEALYYLIFAGALVATPTWRFRCLAIGLVALPVIGVLIHDAWYLGFNAMALQFLAGAWFAKLHRNARMPGRSAGFRLVGVAFIGFVALSFFDLYETLIRPILWGLPALALVAGLVLVEVDGGLPRIRWLQVLGDASYSIYLTHLMVTESLGHVINTGRLVYVPTAIAAALAAGIACHFLLERPLLALFRRRTRPALPSTTI